MARTEIHQISTTLNIAIDYIIDPEKTDDQRLCSTYECTLQCATMDFEDVRFQGTGRTTVLAEHIIQSFKPGEVTPEEAHKIGRELCDKYLKGQYQYVIATHIDKEHIHNHIIFNNINLESFKSFEYLENRGKDSAERLRQISDEICDEHNLSVIKNPERGTSKSYYEWQQDKIGNSWKSKLRNAIDKAVKGSSNFEEFLNKMQEQGYEYKQGKYLSFRAAGQERFTRCKRSTLGWYYEQPQIEKRIERYSSLTSQKTYRTNIIDTSSEKFRNSKGLERWATIRNMQEASRMINLLTENGVSSPDEFDDKLMQLHENRLRLADHLNDIQSDINNAADLLKLLETYRDYKPMYSQYKEVRTKEKYRKEHSSEIIKYESAVRQLKELYMLHKVSINCCPRHSFLLYIQEFLDNDHYFFQSFIPDTFNLTQLCLKCREIYRFILAAHKLIAVSKNVSWGVEKAFRDGRVRYNLNSLYGYRKGEDGKPEIIPEEAEVVRLIYKLYLDGLTLRQISKHLNALKIPKREFAEWSINGIHSILSNEKYVGDALLQKTYTVDCITHKTAKNNGERTKYLVTDAHDAMNMQQFIAGGKR